MSQNKIHNFLNMHYYKIIRLEFDTYSFRMNLKWVWVSEVSFMIEISDTHQKHFFTMIQVHL